MAGIVTINDICHENDNRLLSHEEISQKFGITCTFLDTMRLRMGIPLHWRSVISSGFRAASCPTHDIQFSSGTILSVITTSSKRLYSEIVAQKRGLISSQRRWEGMVDISGQEEWRDIYCRTFTSARETKIQALQFRIVHRTITCNKLLLQYRLREDDKCSQCEQPDTLEHFFYQCTTVRTLWRLVLAWILVATGIDIRQTGLKEALLGFPKEHPHSRMVNYLLMSARFVIHRQRLFHDSDLCLIHWVRELRNRLLTEQHICQAEGKPNKFDCWGRALEYAG